MSLAPMLVEKADELGVDVRYHTRMIHLVQNDQDTVTGIIAEDENGKKFEIKAMKGTILCTGGYANNVEMLEDLNPAALEENVYSDAPANYGEGISAGTWIGAARDKMPAVLVFDRGIVPPGTKAEETYIMEPFKDFFWMGSQPFLKLNINGERFANESVPYDYIVNAAGYQPGNMYVMVWDSNYRQHIDANHTLGCSRIEYPSPTGGMQTYVSAGGYDGNDKQIQDLIERGYIVKADTIEELAAKLQLPVETATQHIERYNELCEKGIDEDFGNESSRLHAVKEGPFYGCLLGGRILSTLDGLKINTNMQVLRKDGSVIAGLYAAGNDSGGFFAYTYPERLPGTAVSRAFTFGWLAGEHAAGIK
ncbi:FAD-binding protein [Aerococcaceae bacterium DSM 111020]|nr:FAD-binding protein [Aerococcaceae bacterium DSM 111020]